uniref:Plectin/eS10 N-terminal domain-containing protein n=1 Tax=Monopterus albus TaxID=43700 RepID=A0A3Q3IUA9_MONAL
MLMPLRDLRAIYEVLFRDGVMVAKKDRRPQIKHPDVHDVSNLQVIRAMGSLKSRGYVKETFTWRHFYWYLTNEGIVYLRDYLHLPPEIVPASLQRVRKPAASQAITQMMGPGERENYFDRTPRFRGRPLAAEPVSPDTDEATMKRKIVVVEEEIVEVKQLVNPQAAGEQTSPPPPVQCEAEEVERDMGIKGQIISEMALLNRDEGAKMKEASADTEWDHSLEEPQEKKWPNFIEGLFECMPVDLLPALSCSLCM